jgi:hypothetical protein
MRRLTPIPHHRRHQTVGVRRVELGIRAVRTASAMAVRPKHASSGQPRPFILRVGAVPSQFDRAEGASSDQKHKEISDFHDRHDGHADMGAMPTALDAIMPARAEVNRRTI